MKVKKLKRAHNIFIYKKLYMEERSLTIAIHDKTSILMKTHVCETTDDILNHVNKTLVSHPNKRISIVIDNNTIHDKQRFY